MLLYVMLVMRKFSYKNKIKAERKALRLQKLKLSLEDFSHSHDENEDLQDAISELEN